MALHRRAAQAVSSSLPSSTTYSHPHSSQHPSPHPSTAVSGTSSAAPRCRSTRPPSAESIQEICQPSLLSRHMSSVLPWPLLIVVAVHLASQKRSMLHAVAGHQVDRVGLLFACSLRMIRVIRVRARLGVVGVCGLLVLLSVSIAVWIVRRSASTYLGDSSCPGT